MMAEAKTLWFCFDQNNSGGQFDTSRGHKVIIEAVDAAHAESRAVDHGLYFDGCEKGIDCSCCGDRWHRLYGDDGAAEPEVYGEPAAEWVDYFKDNWGDGRSVEIVPLVGAAHFIAPKSPA